VLEIPNERQATNRYRKPKNKKNMKKFVRLLLLIILSGTLLTSCGWSGDDKEKYMSKCQAEVLVGIGLLKGGEKLFDKDLTSKVNLNPNEICECTYKVDESLYNSFEEYDKDRGDKRKLSSSMCQKCFNK
jgi:hypothetical protein